jgi:hypothetical protein
VSEADTHSAAVNPAQPSSRPSPGENGWRPDASVWSEVLGPFAMECGGLTAAREALAWVISHRSDLDRALTHARRSGYPDLREDLAMEVRAVNMLAKEYLRKRDELCARAFRLGLRHDEVPQETAVWSLIQAFTLNVSMTRWNIDTLRDRIQQSGHRNYFWPSYPVNDLEDDAPEVNDRDTRDAAGTD